MKLLFSRLRLFAATASQMPFYSVARGRKPGIYTTWPECEAQVKGFQSACFKKFNTRSEAESHCASNKAGGQASTSSGASSSAKPTWTAQTKRSFSTASNSPSSSRSVAGGPSKRTKLIELPERKPTPSGDDSIKMQQFDGLDFPVDSEGFVIVYTDGSCENNGKKNAIAGLGVYFAEGHTLNTAKPVSGRATNNCGEIQAASEAIRLAHQYGIRKLCIRTDSQFVINSVTKWMDGWIRKDWRLASGQPVKNVVDFKELRELLKRHSDMQVRWEYVKAHCGIVGNERADELARRGGQLFKADRADKQQQ